VKQELEENKQTLLLKNFYMANPIKVSKGDRSMSEIDEA
jgi:hypothetical protein